MKNKTKDIHNSIMKIGAAMLALAVAAGASTPAITSFTQAQPVTKTKKKAKAKKKTKAKTTVLKAVTLTKGKSITVSVKTKSKVRWTSSNAKVASVKSISKSKVKVYAKKEGSTKVSGKAGSAKWSFTVKVKGNKKTVSKFYFKIDSEPSRLPNTVKFFWPGVATNPRNENGLSSYKASPVDIEGSSHPEISATVDDNSKVKCFSSDPSTLKVVKPDLSAYVKSYIHFDLIPYKTGTVTLTMTYPGGEYKKKVTVKPSAVYEKIKNLIPAVKNSGLDDTHKAFVIAAWQCKHMAYGYSKSGGLYGDIVEGKGVCDDYTAEYNFLLSLIGIKSRRVASLSIDHAWSQVLINNKWYNVDTTAADAYNLIDNPSWYSGGSVFMKSDTFTVHYNTPEYAKYGMCDNQDEVMFNDKMHAVKYRSGNGEYPVTATATDYDSYDWSSFAQSEQLKSLIS